MSVTGSPRLVLLAVSALFISSVASVDARGSVILIDGTAADGYVRDGSFEDGGLALGSFWQTAPSTLSADLGINASSVYLERDSIAGRADGLIYGVVGVNSAIVYGLLMDTGHNLAEGDTFDLGFSYGVHSGPAAGDQLTVQLFTTTTNDTTGTVDTVVFTTTVTYPNANPVIYTESLSGVGSVGASLQGKRLFLAVTMTNATDTFSLASVDAVNLSANPIPEPGSLALMGLATGLILTRRRR